MEKIGFGGGCHWCTEAVFQALIGVARVEQGFIRSKTPFDSWSEAVIVTFDSSKIDCATLIEVHIRTHSSTSQHSMRGKYRSAIYVFGDEQNRAVRHALDSLQAEFDDGLVTKILDLVDFKSSDGRFHNYYRTNPERPFCKAYIDPKLAKIRAKFSRLLADQSAAAG